MKLKPCPFCGGKPRTINRSKIVFDSYYGVGCSNPLCIIYLPKDVSVEDAHNYVWMYTDELLMVEAWNKRHHNKPIEIDVG